MRRFDTILNAGQASFIVNMSRSDTAGQLKTDTPLDHELAGLQLEPRRKEEIFHAQQFQLEANFSSSIDAMVHIDFKGKIKSWNQVNFDALTSPPQTIRYR